MVRTLSSHSIRRWSVGLALVGAVGCHHAPPPASRVASEDAIRIGYGSQARDQVTGAVGSVSSRDLSEVRETRVEEILRGRFAGVDVVRMANGAYSIRIRGMRSFIGGNEPLVVIDGIPSPRGLQNPLSDLTPQNVARIDILKDAGSTAAYGGRGANGVILVTTKRGGL